MIDWPFYRDFQNWLAAEPRRHSMNYAAKGFSVIRQFMREAKRLGYHTSSTFEEMKLGTEPVMKIALNFDELDRISALDLSNRLHLERARDLFIVGAFTGLRFSDFSRIRPEHVVAEGGKKYLDMTTIKTGTPVVIPLFHQAEAVLQKYQFEMPKTPASKLNIYIKTIGQLAGIDEQVVDVRTLGGQRVETIYPKYEKLSSHTCRRSFATNFYLLGVPAAMLMKITGHSTERQFMTYINVTGKENAKMLVAEVEKRMRKNPSGI